METITLKIKNKAQLRHFMKIIKDLEYVEVLSNESTVSQKEHGSGEDLMAIAGIWQDRDISSETLIAKAWARKI